MPNNKPSHILYITDRENKRRKTRAGAVWTNDDGWMTLQLGPGIHLSYEEQNKYFFSLYPNVPFEERDPASLPGTGDKNDEDDIPFD